MESNLNLGVSFLGHPFRMLVKGSENDTQFWSHFETNKTVVFGAPGWANESSIAGLQYYFVYLSFAGPPGERFGNEGRD